MTDAQIEELPKNHYGIDCPWCGKSLDMELKVWYNTDAYQESAIGRAKCCGELVDVVPLRRYRVTKHQGNKTVDDWGE